jgi:hypothetical protein
MSFSILIFAYRKPGISPAEFKSHHEEINIPLAKSLAEDTFPNKHIRRYIHRPESPVSEMTGNTNANYPATVLVGTPKYFDYDSISELVFDDEAAFHKFFAVVRQSEVAAKLAVDEEIFLDRGRMTAVVLGDCTVTEK